MRKKITLAVAAAAALLAAGTANAQDKPIWNGPFGGTFTMTLTGITDYSYRGISQTMRDPAFQPSFTYETARLGPLPITAYIGAWGSNVNYPTTTGSTAEIDVIAGLRGKALNDKLTADLGYIRYNYLGANENLGYGFNEFGLVLGYDFDVVAVQAAIRHSPNFFANSGSAWYKWAQVTVPLPFIKVHDEVAFKLFGNIGNQYVERFVNYGIPRDNYWDWQVGLTATVYGVDLTLAYTDISIDRVDCGNTANCDARVIFSISKTF